MTTVEYAPSQVDELSKVILDHFKAYLVNDDMDGAIHDLAIFIEANVEDPDDIITDLTDNTDDYVEGLEQEDKEKYYASLV